MGHREGVAQRQQLSRDFPVRSPRRKRRVSGRWPDRSQLAVRQLGAHRIEGDFNWTNRKQLALPDRPRLSRQPRLDRDRTGRFGVIYDRALLYVKGVPLDQPPTAWTSPSLGAVAASSGEDNNPGRMLSHRHRIRLYPSWSAKIEYNLHRTSATRIHVRRRRRARPQCERPREGAPGQSGLKLQFNWGGSSY